MDMLAINFGIRPLTAGPAPTPVAPPAPSQPPTTSTPAPTDTTTISKPEGPSQPPQAPKADSSPKNPIQREIEKNNKERDKIINDPQMLEQLKKMIDEILKMR